MDYAAGILCGVAFAVLIWWLFHKKLGMRGTYDERQLILRGKAFQYGFYTILGYNMLYTLAASMTGRALMEPTLCGVLGVYLGVLVLGAYSIWKDAFFPVGGKQRYYVVLLFLVAGMQLVGTVGCVRDGTLVENGVLTANCVMPVSAVAFVILGIEILVKHSREAGEAEE